MSYSEFTISELIQEIRKSTSLQLFFFCFCPDASATKPILLLQPCTSGDPQKMFEAAVRTISSTEPPRMGVAHLDTDGIFRFASPLFQEDDISILARWIHSNQELYPDLKRLYFSQMILVDEKDTIIDRYMCTQIWETMNQADIFSNQNFAILQKSIEERRGLYFWLSSSNLDDETFLIIRSSKKEIQMIMRNHPGERGGIHGQLKYSDKGFFMFRATRLFENFLSTLVPFVRDNKNMYPELELLYDARMICKKDNQIVAKERNDDLWQTIK